MPPADCNIVTTFGHGRRRCVMSAVGAFFTLLGLVCGLFWNTILSSVIDKAMILRPNSKVFDIWKTPPLEIITDIYLYNWTNPKDFRNLSTKPMLEQVGPYRFVESLDKVDIHWHPENASVSYRRKTYYTFDAANSRGSLSDEIITLNHVALAAAGKAKHKNSVIRGMIDLALAAYGNDISLQKTVDELLFTGYSDILLDLATALPMLMRHIEIPFDKFGYCYNRNGSTDLTGFYNVYTGADDISKIGQVHTWNHRKHTGKFESHCGTVHGSAGEFQPPNVDVNARAHIFVPELCRSLPMEYEATVDVEGLKAYKYVAGRQAVDNGSLYPENECFCGGECVPSGLVNISSCWFNAPIFLSYPHFYQADPSYLDSVDGLKPNRDEHECYMVLEPRTGYMLDAAARLQFNFLVEPLPYLDLFRKVPRVFFPMLWFEERVRVPSNMLTELKMLPIALVAGKVAAALLVVVGLGLLAWTRIRAHLDKKQCIDLRYETDIKDEIKPHSDYLQPTPASRFLSRTPLIEDNVTGTLLAIRNDNDNTTDEPSVERLPPGGGRP